MRASEQRTVLASAPSSNSKRDPSGCQDERASLLRHETGTFSRYSRFDRILTKRKRDGENTAQHRSRTSESVSSRSSSWKIDAGKAQSPELAPDVENAPPGLPLHHVSLCTLKPEITPIMAVKRLATSALPLTPSAPSHWRKVMGARRTSMHPKNYLAGAQRRTMRMRGRRLTIIVLLLMMSLQIGADETTWVAQDPRDLIVNCPKAPQNVPPRTCCVLTPGDVQNVTGRLKHG